MSEAEKVFLGVSTFRLGTDKEAALKPLEEAAEVYAEWQIYVNTDTDFMRELTWGPQLAYELADCVTACCNLAARYRLDLQDALDRVEKHNRERGRYE